MKTISRPAKTTTSFDLNLMDVPLSSSEELKIPDSLKPNKQMQYRFKRVCKELGYSSE